MDIRQEIANKRLKRIKTEGYGLSVKIPSKREFPLVRNFIAPTVICEVKRGSPSKGEFAKNLDAVAQGKHYAASGVKCISVLTEEDRFLGSLQDLMDIKENCPNVGVLRKDFLLDMKDVEVSYLCGADAFLLIASLLTEEEITAMYKKGEELGMMPLVEVHSKHDVEKVRKLQPKLMGINSRNLRDFTIDPLRPLKIRSYINWNTRVIYESGILNKENGEFARDCGFSGVLVGEQAVKNKSFARELVTIFNSPRKFSPWEKLFNRYHPNKPFIKICGITNLEDATAARDMGADILGFILAESPRKVTIDFIKECKVLGILKVGVVVLKKNEELPNYIKELIAQGYLDFIQFHGDETKEDCIKAQIPFYKAIQVKDFDSLKRISEYPNAVLIDSFSEGARGGTGKQINSELTTKASEKPNLWLAGGLSPENIKEVVKKYKPDLIDVSSGLEDSIGKKSITKMKKYFKELK